MFCNNRTVGLYFPLSVIYYYNNIITIPSTLFYHTFPKLFSSDLHRSWTTYYSVLITPSDQTFSLLPPPPPPSPGSASHNYFHDLIKEIQFLTDRAQSWLWLWWRNIQEGRKDLNKVETELFSEYWHLGLTADCRGKWHGPCHQAGFYWIFKGFSYRKETLTLHWVVD